MDAKYLSFPQPGPPPAPQPAPPIPPASAPPATPSVVPAATTPPPGYRFIWPVASRRISTYHGEGGHNGIDLDEYPAGGNPVMAIADGVVSFAGGTLCCSYGLYIIIQHADGYSSLYAHLSSINVAEGQSVSQGTVIGLTGNTGRSTGPHLHFEIRLNDVSIDPLPLLPR